MSIGRKIKRLRLEREYSQKDLSKLLNIAYQSVGNYEREERELNYSMLKKYAEIFDVSVDWLMGRTDDRQRHITEEKEIPPEYIELCETLGIDAIRKAKAANMTTEEWEAVIEMAKKIKGGQ